MLRKNHPECLRSSRHGARQSAAFLRLPVCGPVQGCDTVALSPYSEIAGVPVAFLGFGYSLVMLGLIAAWLRRGDRLLLHAAYSLGLLGVVFVAYLTYLELFVIQAVCIWCATYAASVIAIWICLAIALRRSPA